ncbi:MAG: flagellar hook-associated protein FlgK [Candidatus Microbacterium phytovorans]|uniref:Flagellar hook-associated protein 1 n=1 Tax=Candidatus Microbacterium phytovorans TaxID=3121374 RepID=A0AAJ6B2D3_9MICO|nr:flagellar hook-associated protein FlgK [Microbacterium sp.]WEK13053.1 MAG: flagellar hook-associated protein FlgK [Microbacterium sp.]
MSTFSGLSTAASALTAARRGMDLVGQNIANQTTAGYTRQRLETSSVAAVAVSGRFSTGAQPGGGVSIDGIARLGDAVLDARVRDTLAASGYWSTRATASSAAEVSLREPTADGIAHQLTEFWASWQDLANSPDSTAAAATVLTHAQTLAARIADGYRTVAGQWADARSSADMTVSRINAAATEIADLNATIRDAVAAGGAPNELIDRRNLLAQNVARLSGATASVESDGTLTMRIDGNALVSGAHARALTLSGPPSIESTDPLTLSWVSDGDLVVSSAGGELGGLLSVLAPAGEGGVLAGLADDINALATALADAVNTQHRAGVTATGVPGGDFFSLAAGIPAALGLGVIPTGRADLALAAPGAGPLDGSNADALSGVGGLAGGPDDLWGDVVARLAVGTAADAGRAGRADAAATAAVIAQQSVAGVDNDEETVSLLTFQTAYQAAARVLTAVDEALDVLINRTGLVGR